MAAFLVTPLLVLITLVTLPLRSEQIDLSGVQCAAGPYLDYNVPIQENGHNVFTPFSVAVNRCSGTNDVDSPSLRACVATETEKVAVSVTRRVGAKEKTTVQVENHKKCEYQCKDDGSKCPGDPRFYHWDNTTCQCQCHYKWEVGHFFCDASARPVRQWDDHFCGCKCLMEPACPEGSEVNESDCTCRATCKEGAIVRTTIDPQASTGKKPASANASAMALLNQQLTVGTLIIALVIQAVVILIFFAVAQAIGACRRDSQHRSVADVEMKQPPHKFDRELARTPSRPEGYVNDGITR